MLVAGAGAVRTSSTRQSPGHGGGALYLRKPFCQGRCMALRLPLDRPFRPTPFAPRSRPFGTTSRWRCRAGKCLCRGGGHPRGPQLSRARGVVVGGARGGHGDWYREGRDGNAQIRDARPAGRTGRAPPSAPRDGRSGPSRRTTRGGRSARSRTSPPGVVLLFGSERFGLPRELIDRADEVVGIPMYGVNHSFPVAVAAGIVMHEWARRRYRDGAVV